MLLTCHQHLQLSGGAPVQCSKGVGIVQQGTVFNEEIHALKWELVKWKRLESMLKV